MRPDAFWKIELMENISMKKSFILKFLIPLVLVVPLLIDSIPVPVRAGGFTLALAFIGIFGTAVGVARLRENHQTDRLALLPVDPWKMLVGYIGMNSMLDAFQFLVPLLIFALPWRLSFSSMFIIGICYLSVIVASNTIGMFTAAVARSSGEGHLVSILVILMIIGVSGLFIPASPVTGFTPDMLGPFHNLSDALQSGLLGFEVNRWLLLAPVSALVFLGIVVPLAPTIIKGE
jgi:hypothetical protein